MKAVIGIDPGKSGAAVLITLNRKIHILRFQNKTKEQIRNQFFEWTLWYQIEGFVEQVHHISGGGGTSAFTFGMARQFAEDCFLFNHIDYQSVAPQVWQRSFKLGKAMLSTKVRKHAHLDKAKELFPDLKITLDLADALLIAQYGYQKTFVN